MIAGCSGDTTPGAAPRPALSDAGGDADASDPAACESPEKVFERRIEPLLTDSRPKSCNRCHLSGMDLSTFARDSACETMACLVDQDLVDLADPTESTVLQWIRRAEPGGPITQALVDQEYEGFLSWIEYHATCGEACAGVVCSERSHVVCGVDASRGFLAAPIDRSDCSEPAIEAAFQDRVYAWRRRCFPCHTDGSTLGPTDAPRWIHASDDCGLGAVVTLRNIAEYIDASDPVNSLLLTKPLAEAAGGVYHGGHDKFLGPGDEAYDDFLSWLLYYASCQ